MDATPVTLGQEFGGYAAAVRHGVQRARDVLPDVGELPLGGTAVGTGLNAPAGFAAAVIDHLAADMGLPLTEAPQPLRGGRRPRRPGRRQRRRQDHRGQPVQDLQRPAAHGVGAADRAGRDPDP